jgi:ATP-dependent RNA helicase SUPV3L1/SUV3
MPPKGSTGDGGFKVTEEMMSILGCSASELGEVLKALGFRLEQRPIVSKPAQPEESVAKDAAAALNGGTPPEAATPVVEAATPAPEAAAEPTPPVTPEEASAVTADPAPAEAEKFEEIWRPRRHQRSEHRSAGRRDRGREERQRHHHRKLPGTEAPPAEPGTAATVAVAGGSEAHQEPAQSERSQERSGRPRHENHRGEARNDRGPRKDAANRPRRPSDNRENRHGEGRRRDEPRRTPQMITAAPPKPASAEASSPFAALAALKAQMEKRSDDSGST